MRSNHTPSILVHSLSCVSRVASLGGLSQFLKSPHSHNDPGGVPLDSETMDGLFLTPLADVERIHSHMMELHTLSEEAEDLAVRSGVLQGILRSLSSSAPSSAMSGTLFRFGSSIASVSSSVLSVVDGARSGGVDFVMSQGKLLSNLSSALAQAQGSLLGGLDDELRVVVQAYVSDVLRRSDSSVMDEALKQALSDLSLQLDERLEEQQNELLEAFNDHLVAPGLSSSVLETRLASMTESGKLSQDDLFRLLPRITWESLVWSDGVAPSVSDPRRHLIEKGAFGGVYRSSLGQIGPVAVKILAVEKLKAQQEVAFFKECWMMHQVHTHRGIPTLHGVLREEGRVGLVMSLARGGSLNDLLEDDIARRWMRQPVCVRMRLLLGIVSAMAYLHERGVIHGDLKTSNVLLSHKLPVVDTSVGASASASSARAAVVDEDDVSGSHPLRLWLCDFGMSSTTRAVSMSRMKSSLLASLSTPSTGGTWTYMSPEVMKGGKTSFAADVYALSLVLWAGLVGEEPFTGPLVANFDAFSSQVSKHGLRPDVGRLSEDVPASVCELLSWMWDGDASRRPSMDEVFLAWQKSTEECEGAPLVSITESRELSLDEVTRTLAKCDGVFLGALSRYGSVRDVSRGLGYAASITSVMPRWGEMTREDGEVLGRLLRGNGAMTRLDLTENRMGDQGAVALSGALGSLVQLRKLVISSNSVGDTGVLALGDAWRSLSLLQELFISSNNVSDTGAEALGATLPSLPHLRVLNLSNNSIGNVGVVALSDALTTLTNLESLDLSSNRFHESGAVALSGALGSLMRLRELYIHNNLIGTRGAETLGRVLPSLTALRRLHVYCLLRDESGAVALGKALASLTNLRELYFYDNGIGDAGARIVSDALGSLTNLERLGLSDNNISDVGATDLSRGLRLLPHLTACFLFGNKIGPDGAKGLFDALLSLSKLQQLDICRNAIGDAGAAALSVAVRSLTTLEELGLSSNSIGEDGAVALSAALPSLVRLQELNLSKNNIGELGSLALSEALPSLTKLRFLILRGNSLGADGRRALEDAKPASVTFCVLG
jgi:serine/threonine protein kinase/Ran GTPase-activating protein (RanGAP) involved in mRNA processing and transport